MGRASVAVDRATLVDVLPDDSCSEVKSTAGFHLGFLPKDPLLLANAAILSLVGQHSGLIRRVGEVPWASGMPRLHLFLAQGSLRAPRGRFRRFRNPPDGTGISPDPELARVAAVAEAVERYCSLLAPAYQELLVSSDFSSLAEPAVAPPSFASLSGAQYRRAPWLEPLTNTKEIEWCWSYSLLRQRPVLIPAAYVHFSRGVRPPNNFLPELISTGSACHVSLSQAVLAGLCEVLERDALAIAWHARIPLIPLTPEGTVAEILLHDSLADCGASFSLYKVPSLHPFSSIMAVARAGTEPYSVVGAACRPDPVEAAVKALCEAAQMLWRLRLKGVTNPLQIRDLEDHANMYATKKGAELLDRHLLCSESPIALAELPRNESSVAGRLDCAVEQLGERDLEVLVTDLTTADVASSGFRVVRVVVPGTMDITADARFPRLGSQRLYGDPVILGVRDRPLPVESLNLLPAPLA